MVEVKSAKAFALGAVLAALLVACGQASPTPVPTATPTPVPTATATVPPTMAPTPSPTASPSPTALPLPTGWQVFSSAKYGGWTLGLPSYFLQADPLTNWNQATIDKYGIRGFFLDQRPADRDLRTPTVIVLKIPGEVGTTFPSAAAFRAWVDKDIATNPFPGQSVKAENAFDYAGGYGIWAIVAEPATASNGMPDTTYHFWSFYAVPGSVWEVSGTAVGTVAWNNVQSDFKAMVGFFTITGQS